MPIQIDIVTTDRQLLSTEVDMVILPGADGQMGILRGHAPLISLLDIGEIVLHRGNEVEYIAVSGGIVEVRPNKVTVLAATAEAAEEIDADRAEAALERARQSLVDNPPPQQRLVIEAAMRRNTLRLKTARRRGGGQRQGPTFDG